MVCQKKDYEVYQNGKRSNVTAFELLIYDDVENILIEDYPCKSRNQLLARERYFIDQNKDICVNGVIPIVYFLN